MTSHTTLKKIAVPILLCLVTLLGYKFVAWNWWKVERATTMARSVLKAHPAVNIQLTLNGKPLFHKSFPYNTKGNYYLINQFDISPYAHPTPPQTLTFRLNHETFPSPPIFLFDTFSIVPLHNAYFVFTNARCDIEAFIRLRAFLPKMAETFIWLLQHPMVR